MFFNLQVSKLDEVQHQRYFISSPQILLAVNAVMTFSFLSRGLYQLGAVFNWFELSNIPLQVIVEF